MIDVNMIDFQLLMKIIQVLATFVAAWLINRYAVTPALNQHFKKLDVHSRMMVSRVASIILYLIAVIITFSILELSGPATALLGSLGIAGIVIGLAVKDFVTDILSGFLVYTEKPFKVGDAVELEGKFGTVKDITTRVTRLETYDGEMITIPNSKIRTMSVINKTRTGPYLRVVVPIGIDYAADPEKAMSICMRVLKRDPRIESEPEPTVFVRALGDSAVQMDIRYWINIKQESLLRVKSDVIVKVKKKLEEAGITIPFPQVTISKRK